uniref:Uncharacterized protein n=1 Tax=Ditylum brightwellii TaxID=49249 RepID=A0A6S9A1A8_9STRA|mmetsp:Transcript_10410/g.13945  ORF Transcript_10410/g.13945 Transcript_10410/m.13945 type:complete len:120 (+) Transcript_10410:796-1155(+)
MGITTSTLARSNKILFAGSLLLLVTFVEGRKRRERETRLGRNPDVDRYDEVYTLVSNCFLFALAPAIFSFMYSLVTDPAVPMIGKALWSYIMEGFTKNLGQVDNGSFGGEVDVESRRRI